MFFETSNQMNKVYVEKDGDYEIREYDIYRYNPQDLTPSNVNFVIQRKPHENISQRNYLYIGSNKRLNPKSKCICDLKCFQNRNYSSSNFTPRPIRDYEREINFNNSYMSNRNLIMNNNSFYENICPSCRQKLLMGYSVDEIRGFSLYQNNNSHNSGNFHLGPNIINQNRVPKYQRPQSNINIYQNIYQNQTINRKGFAFSLEQSQRNNSSQVIYNNNPYLRKEVKNMPESAKFENKNIEVSSNITSMNKEKKEYTKESILKYNTNPNIINQNNLQKANVESSLIQNSLNQNNLNYNANQKMITSTTVNSELDDGMRISNYNQQNKNIIDSNLNYENIYNNNKKFNMNENINIIRTQNQNNVDEENISKNMNYQQQIDINVNNEQDDKNNINLYQNQQTDFYQNNKNQSEKFENKQNGQAVYPKSQNNKINLDIIKVIKIWRINNHK